MRFCTSNDNGIVVVNVATSEYLFVKSTVFPHRKIYGCSCTSLDEKTFIHTDHVLVGRIWWLQDVGMSCR
jgi:hypothetical protein